MSPHAILTRHPETIATEIDGEVVLMSLSTGRTFGLDSRASKIWAMIEEPKPVSAVVAALLKQYAISPQQCETDVVEFAKKLSEAQLATATEPTVDAK